VDSQLLDEFVGGDMRLPENRPQCANCNLAISGNNTGERAFRDTSLKDNVTPALPDSLETQPP
jgi:hypothetical protein